MSETKSETIPETFSLRLQGSIYLIAGFSGNMNAMMSVVMPLWALELGASPLLIGLIIASRQVLSVGFSIHGGALMDRLGPRRVIATLGLTGAVLVALYPAAPYIWAAILLQLLTGFIETTNWIGAQSLVGKLLKGRAVYAGRMTAAARLGGFAGPLLAGLAWQFWGPAGAFYVVAAWVLAAAFAALTLPDIPLDEKREAPADDTRSAPLKALSVLLPRWSDYRTALGTLVIPAVALVIVATVMRQTGSGIQTAFYSVWLKEIGYSAGTIGFLIGTGNLVSAGAALS
ncbi:MAG: MFS transporter, partial [Rhodospirillales bacterium]|nr:MFS transporter [Rhodospirillales bacterium]